MLFWFIAALLTLAACLAVLHPMVRRPRGLGKAAEHDLEVYRDQLAELERDAARGTISQSEAEEARNEIARRILKADSERGETTASSPRIAPRWAMAAAILAIPVISWTVYSMTGSPDIPSQPLAARLEKNPTESTIEELIARAENHLRANPEDGQGWEVLGPIYMRVNRFEDAANAYRNAISLMGKSSARLSAFGEAITAVGEGVVSAEAQDAFKQAVGLDPANAKSRFFLAVAQAQEGDLAGAIAAWRAFADSQPADSPWRQVAFNAIAQAEREMAAADGAAEPGPTRDQVAAAQDMTAGERNAMIESMVAQLDEKLRTNPDDMAGWQRLVKAYTVLGRKADASAAVDRAVGAFGADSAKVDEIVAFARSLGVETPAPAAGN